ncbi:MAG: type II toxin-antitoxin system VapC family toxin [Thermoleophilaceae bacterium]
MLVVDASALVELLLGLPRAEAVAAELRSAGPGLHAPDLLDLEIVSALRRREAAGLVTGARCEEGLEDLDDLSLARHSSRVLARRAWRLRDNFTPYDGVYVALAEALDCPLLTTDKPLGRAIQTHTSVRAQTL